jgi:hypothetical protein
MSYLPRPEAERVAEDVDLIYSLAAEALQRASSPADRRKSFHTALLRAFEAGVDAQREMLHSYTHNHPTPIPPPPASESDLTDPGLLPAVPTGVFLPKRRKL